MNVGTAYLNGKGTDQDFSKAEEFYRLAAERGMPQACVNLSEMRRLGIGRPESYDEARQWLEKAVALGLTGVEQMLKDLDEYVWVCVCELLFFGTDDPEAAGIILTPSFL